MALTDEGWAPGSQSHVSSSGKEPWTRDRVNDDILGAQSRGIHLNHKSVMTCCPKLYSKAYRLFGSWENAVRDSGIDYAAVRLRKKWTPEGILEWIRERRRKEEDLHPGFVKLEHAGAFNAAVRVYGGWYPAIRAAGITDFEEVPIRKWSHASVVQAIRRLGARIRRRSC